MSDRSPLERCLAFVEVQLDPASRAKARPARRPRRPVVTMSRQTGLGAPALAQSVASALEARLPRKAGPWAVFDKELVDRLLEEEDLPARLKEFSAEDPLSGLAFAVEELLGLHRPAWRPIQERVETILRLGEMGNVVFVGRAANIILSHLPNALHVRLVGSEERRVELVQGARGLSRKAAEAWVRKEDEARRRFIRKYFQADVADPLRYDLLINTDRVSQAETMELIVSTVLSRTQQTD